MSTTYRIADMRVLTPSAKVKAAHPERVVTIVGRFAEVKDDGTIVPMTVRSKAITLEQVASGVDINLAAQTLTIHGSGRGRPVSASLAQSEVDALLAAAIAPEAEAEVKAEDAPTA